MKRRTVIAGAIAAAAAPKPVVGAPAPAPQPPKPVAKSVRRPIKSNAK